MEEQHKVVQEEEREGAGRSEQDQSVERQEGMDGTSQSQPRLYVEEEEEGRTKEALEELEKGLQMVMVKECTKGEENMEEDYEGGKHVVEDSEEEEHGWCDPQKGENQQAVDH